MERPQNVFALTAHLVRVKWQALTPRGRMIAVAAATFVGLAVASAGVHAASCSHECCSGCPSQAAAHHPCPYSQH